MHLRALAFLIAILFLQARNSPAATADGCDIASVGIDTTRSNLEVVAWNRRFPSQLFVAPDTLIHSITLWRPARNESTYTSAKLFIMDVDSSYGLQRPDPNRVLLDGPSLLVQGGDGIHPIEMTWTFEPPLALPRRGQFGLEVKPDPCYGIFVLLAASGDPYPGGSLWQFDPTDCIGPGCCAGNPWEGTIDLVFRVDLCEFSVPTVASTWGRFKASYH